MDRKNTFPNEHEIPTGKADYVWYDQQQLRCDTVLFEQNIDI